MPSCWCTSSSRRTALPGVVFDQELLDERPGFVAVLFSGEGANALFGDEAGGHRWQRVPETEKRGRVQTSTVTVAVLSAETKAGSFDLNDVTFTATTGTGPGGQHRNKTASCIEAVHEPTGIKARIDGRSQHRNKAVATKVLAARWKALQDEIAAAEKNSVRRGQIGAGMRGDKIRTYRTKDDRVVDHRTGEKKSLTKWMKGEW